MNHQRIYENIIEEAKFENRTKGNGIYYENHHIQPKCLDGRDEDSNLVLLTAKEHFVVHKLLTYIYPTNRDLATAFHFMVYGAKNKEINLSSRDYEYAKELGAGEKNPFFGLRHTLETKKKMSKAASLRVGEKNGNFGNTLSKEAKEKISKAHKGKEISIEQRRLISKKLKGRKFSEEHINKIRNSKIGKPRPTKTCKYCGKEMAVGNFERYHNENCKLK